MDDRNEKGQFRPGRSINGGHPGLPPELKRARKHTKITVAMILNRLWNMPAKELVDHIKNDKLSTIEMMLARMMASAIKNNDPQRAEMLLNRSIGKVTDNLQHSLPKPTVIKLIGEDAALVMGQMNEDDDFEGERL